MQPVYFPNAADTGTSPSVDGVASHSRHLLQDVLRVSRGWLERLSLHDPERDGAARLQVLVEDLLRDGNTSPSALSNVRALLCTRCRHLNAAQGRCTGRSLDRCELLRTPQS